ncbi:MAG: rhizoferrin import MFS transporter FslD [Rickettsiaceae bacterium]
MIRHLPVLLVISLLTCSVEVDISVPSFPDISDYFVISDGLTQMTIALNFLGFCISSAFYGPLSDFYGRRKVMLVGNAIMAIGAFGCAIANTIELLLLARFIQGLGASTSAVVAFAVIADSYSAKKAASLIGTMNSMITVCMSMAPVAGGFINEVVGWRGNYITIAIISIISWVMLYYWLPETKKDITAFNHKKIINDFKRLLTNRTFICASITPSIIFAGWMSFVACGAFLYTETYDLPIMHYALHQGSIIAVFSFVSLHCGRINNLIGMGNSVKYGTLLILIGSIMLIAVSLLFAKAPYLTSLAMIIYGIGAAITYPVIFAKSLDIFPDIKGTASSAIMSMRALLCAGFIALFKLFLSRIPFFSSSIGTDYRSFSSVIDNKVACNSDV